MLAVLEQHGDVLAALGELLSLLVRVLRLGRPTLCGVDRLREVRAIGLWVLSALHLLLDYFVLAQRTHLVGGTAQQIYHVFHRRSRRGPDDY